MKALKINHVTASLGGRQTVGPSLRLPNAVVEERRADLWWEEKGEGPSRSRQWMGGNWTVQLNIQEGAKESDHNGSWTGAHPNVWGSSV